MCSFLAASPFAPGICAFTMRHRWKEGSGGCLPSSRAVKRKSPGMLNFLHAGAGIIGDHYIASKLHFGHKSDVEGCIVLWAAMTLQRPAVDCKPKRCPHVYLVGV